MCMRCGFEIPFKQTLQRHLQRKTACEPRNKDIDRQVLLCIIQVKKRTVVLESNFCCKVCQKYFSTRYNLNTHIKKCQSNKDVSQLQTQVNELEAKVSSLEMKKTDINNTTNNNVQNNIQIVFYLV